MKQSVGKIDKTKFGPWALVTGASSRDRKRIFQAARGERP
jgi:hypothetical protein